MIDHSVARMFRRRRPGTGSAEDSTLRVHDVHSGYGQIAAVRGVSLAVAPDEAVAVLGPNGAGKSALLRTISGLLRPWSGHIALGASSLAGLAPHQVTRVGVIHVPEGRQILVSQTVKENLLLGAAARARVPDPLALDEVLEVFPLLADKLHRRAELLSGGEQQALALARGVLGNPRVLLLDEPSLGLAPKLIDEVQAFIEVLRRRRRFAMVLVEQDANLAAQVAERVLVMQTGRIVGEHASADLLGHPELLSDFLRGSRQRSTTDPWEAT